MKTRYEVFNDPSLSDQGAIVGLLTKRKTEMEKHVIPGGKELISVISSKETLRNAIYTWLRAKAEFSEFILSFAKDPDRFAGPEIRKEIFQKTEPKPIWHSTPNGRFTLADQLANIISTEKLVSIRVKPDGIYITNDKTKKFSRTTTVTAEDLAAGLYAGKSPGDKVTSTDWEPWYGITPIRKQTKPIRRTE
jgi:hypothetical protein